MDNFIGLDQNMATDNTIDGAGLTWYNVRQAPFALHGFYQPQTENYFHRLPESVGAEVSDAVCKLQMESAGGRVRFSTDSAILAIRAVFRAVGRSSHLTLVSSAGFDLYRDDAFGSEYIKEFRMPYDMMDRYEQAVTVPRGAGMSAYTIHFPVHSVVESLYVGLEKNARLGTEKPYRAMKPMVIYGSSIVHGTAASRPGLIYESLLSRALNMDYINLGFSGQAKGEAPLSRYMASLPMSAFLCDYDYNAPTPEYLAATHASMYQIIREKNADVPYIMITRPSYLTSGMGESALAYRDVVMRSYLKARENGDRSVYFMDGFGFFAGEHTIDSTLDLVHPNDYGFIRMADAIAALLRQIFR